VRVGAGCLFEELYQALDPENLGIVGGSGLAGVGLAGWILGGGYSVKTSQYGLGVDNLEAVRVVLPNGETEVASEKENQDLFFAVKVEYKRYFDAFPGSDLTLLGRRQQLWYSYRIHSQSS
jgi:FAD/FMN-containing dehydrogenase